MAPQVTYSSAVQCSGYHNRSNMCTRLLSLASDYTRRPQARYYAPHGFSSSPVIGRGGGRGVEKKTLTLTLNLYTTLKAQSIWGSSRLEVELALVDINTHWTDR